MHLLVNQVPPTYNSLEAQSPLQSSLAALMKTKIRRRNLQLVLAPLRKGGAQAQNHLLPLRSLLSNMATPPSPSQQSHPVRSQLTHHLRPPQPEAGHQLSLLRNLPSLLPQRAALHPPSLPKFLGMPVPLLKVLNPHQLLGLAERFLLLLRLRIAHMAELREINHILIPHHIGQGGPVALLLRGGDLGLEPLQREVILDPGPLSGVGPGLHRDGGNLEAPSGVAGLGLLSDQAGPGAEIPREEADLGQQDEAGHTPDLQLLGVELVLEHQLEGVGPVLEHLPGADHDPEPLLGVGLGQEHQPAGADLGQEHLLDVDLGPDHQCEGGLVADLQPGEVVGHVLELQPGEGDQGLEPQPGEGDPGLEHQLDVGAHGLEHQPGEGDPGLEHQLGEDPAVEV